MKSALFVGAPPVLAGALEVTNSTSDPISLRGIVAKLEGHERPFELRLHGRAAPKQRARLGGHLLVDGGMPAGTYRGTVHMFGREEPVEVRVLERPSARALPKAIYLTGASHDEVESEVLIENTGNVAFAIGPANSMFFEETYWLGRSLVYAMREANADDGAEKYLDRVVRELRTTMPGTTSVRVASDSKTLEPGAQALVRLTFELPTGLIKGRVYAASLTVAGAHIYVELTCNGAENSAKRRPR